MSNDDLKYWLALKFAEDTGGNVLIAGLVDHFGSPRHVFEASVSELMEVSRVNRAIALHIKSFEDWERVEHEIAAAHELGIAIITMSSPLYPRALQSIYDRPSVLYVKGTLSHNDINIAVVGSRAASSYGKYITDSLLEIIRNGAVLSEFPLNSEPKSSHFPRRNRIISGLSLGVVVVEANEKSGSLITARCALEQGREVFAVPGPVDSPGSKGTHRLIREGAKLTETVDDILEEIIPQLERSESLLKSIQPEVETPHSGSPSHTPCEQALLGFIGHAPAHIDDIIAESSTNAGEVMSTLTSLEIRGIIVQHAGKTYTLKKQHI
ncbi:MAG: DNA-processing protein DprA [Deltaproteobacteria bacterium]|nr:DNA-processing protein DprA [Deltaproteobacteria bacterium]